MKLALLEKKFWFNSKPFKTHQVGLLKTVFNLTFDCFYNCVLCLEQCV